jgi:hypothetical protein
MSDWIYFGKDAVMLVAYVKYFFWKKKNSSRFRIRQPFVGGLILLNLAYGIIEVFNWKLGSLAVGLLGMKAFFFYIPLMFMLPNLFLSIEDMQQFLQRYLLLLIPVCLLGVVQYFSPINSPINSYAAGREADTLALVGREGAEHVRITGTFPYLSGLTSFLIVCSGLLVPLMTVKRQRFYTQILNLLMMGLLICNLFMTGSRTAVGSVLLILIGLFTLNTPSSAIRLFRKLLIPGILCCIAACFMFRKPIENFMHRIEDVGGKADAINRISWAKEAFTNIEVAGAFGYGIGSTHQGTRKVRLTFNLPPGETIPVYYEDESGRITLELGLIGLFLWGMLKLGLIYALWKTYRILHHPLLRQLALAAFLIHIIQFTGTMVFHVTFCIYYWFLAGFIFLLPKLEWVMQIRSNSRQ